jgi:hypothetical protein
LQRVEVLELAESDPERLIKLAMGSDETAQSIVLALLQDEAAQEAEDELERIREWEAQQETQFEAERQRNKRIWELIIIALESLGFVRHARKPWTRSMTEIKSNKSTTGETRAKIRAIVNQAVRPGPGTIEKLRQVSREHPEAFAAEVQCELAHLAAFTLAIKEFSNTKKRSADLLARMQLLALELAGDRPSPARRLAAEAAWDRSPNRQNSRPVEQQRPVVWFEAHT